MQQGLHEQLRFRLSQRLSRPSRLISVSPLCDRLIHRGDDLRGVSMRRGSRRVVVIPRISEWSLRARALSPLHGRTRTLRVSGFGWVNIKGGGWNWGDIPVL